MASEKEKRWARFRKFEGKFVSCPLYELKAQECWFLFFFYTCQIFIGLKTWSTKEQRWAGNMLYPKIQCQPFLPSKQRREGYGENGAKWKQGCRGIFLCDTVAVVAISFVRNSIQQAKRAALCHRWVLLFSNGQLGHPLSHF